MLILALDTTTRTSSCAVSRDGVVLCEVQGDASRPQAVRLPQELIAVLERASIALGDIDAFAVATGPGSFTGLRIGIASMQGLAFAGDKPLIGISALDALAACAVGPAATLASSGMRVATWVDAWRGDVYAAVFEDGRQPDPVVARPHDLLAVFGAEAERDRPTTFIGDGAVTYGDLIRDKLGDRARFADPTTPLLAGTIARLAAVLYDTGARPAADAIHPLYVRRPDAVLVREAAGSRLTPTPAPSYEP